MKQRLVGAVVLVSLAVIFIPMLLDGGDEGGMPMFGSNIPDKPDYHFEPLDIPLEPVEPIAADKPLLVEKAEPAADLEPEEPGPQAAPVTPEPDVPPQQSAQSAEPEAPAPATPDTAQESVAWVVQVGSFSRSENALALRDKLRGAGFTAFVEKLTIDGANVYRVRIGPELKREAAESQLNKLQREMKMEGLVMGHSS